MFGYFSVSLDCLCLNLWLHLVPQCNATHCIRLLLHIHAHMHQYAKIPDWFWVVLMLIVCFIYTVCFLCWHIINNQFCLFKRALTHRDAPQFFSLHCCVPPVSLQTGQSYVSTLLGARVLFQSREKGVNAIASLLCLSFEKSTTFSHCVTEWGLARGGYTTAMEKHVHRVSIENCISYRQIC